MNNNMDTGIKVLAFGGLGFMVGVVVGAMAGVLLAPQSGEETRRQLKDLAGDAKDKMSGLASEAKETVQDLAEKSKQLVSQRK